MKIRNSHWVLLTLLVLLISVFFYSCQKDKDKSWETTWLIPLVNSSVSFSNLSQDTVFTPSPDSTVIFVMNMPVGSIDFSDLLEIPDTTLEITASLKTIKLGSREISQKVTLGQIARQSGPMGQLILNSHGSYLPIPAINNIYGGKTTIQATQYFETVTVRKGTLTTRVFNGLPIEMTDVIVLLKNARSGNLLLHDTIQSLLPGHTFSKAYSLDGKTFEGELIAEILNISSPGSGIQPVKIDTNDAILFSLKISVDEVQSARAIFPAQNLVDQQEDVEYNLHGPELTFMRIKSGKFKIILASTLQDTSYVHYEIPGAKYLGTQPLVFDAVIPPAPPDDTVYIEKTWDVDDYWFDLTGKNGDKVNSFYNSLVLRIDSTGKMVELSLDDSLYIFYTLYNVVPSFVKGFIGSDTVNLNSISSRFHIFNKITSGQFALNQARVNFYIENGVGAPATLNIENLQFERTSSSKKMDLTSTIFSSPISIQPAHEAPFMPSYIELKLDETNSNIKDVIEMMPDKVTTSSTLVINPSGNTGSYDNFIYNESQVNSGLSVEIPLELSLDKLSLCDTLPVDIQTLGSLENVTFADLQFHINNDFPVQIFFQLYMMDENKSIMDSLFKQALRVDGGIVNHGGRVVTPFYSQSESLLSAASLTHLMNTHYFLVKASFTSIPPNQKVKIYSDYQLKFKIIARLGYKTMF